MREKVREYLGRLRLQVHEDPIAAQLGCGKAELEDAKADRT
jgi:hypothetical protein